MFSKPGKVKYGNIHLLAILLSAIHRYHPDFVIGIIDALVESIAFGLEQNDFEFNQRRVAEVKYLGELYNYRMLEHPVIFDAMYKIMTFGHGMRDHPVLRKELLTLTPRGSANARSCQSFRPA